ncbi:MAG TPA: hypothetical protein VHO90_14500 [Bacteroidales bacterium]|jgi:hypothetical protein|nr:hypothetical protein [Bacteroidales bacterium]
MFKSISIHSRSTYWTNKESSEEMLVDSDDLSREIEKVSNNLYKEGYDIVAITPITSGTFSNGNGYFQTESVIITAKKRN